VPFEQWLQAVAALPPEKQVEEVRVKLKERNPKFDGQVKHTIADGQVVQLSFATEHVTDLRPVRALPALKSLNCAAEQAEHGALSDLSPLAGMGLTDLNVNGNLGIHDLSPLRGLPLQSLNFGFTTVEDLSPLRGLPLAILVFHNCGVRDLSPLRGLPLKELRFGGWSSQVSDLSPLEGMELRSLTIQQTQARDLSPLRGMPLRTFDYGLQDVNDLSPLKDSPLEEFRGDLNPWRDAEVLRGIKTLKTINGRPAEQVWEKVDADRAAFDRWAAAVAAMPADDQVRAVAARLKELNPDFDGRTEHGLDNGVVVRLTFSTDGVTDLSPVRALAGLRELGCGGTAGSRKGKLADLSPLRGLKLSALSCNDTQVGYLGPLAGMPLERLDVARTPVRDLTPLKGLPLRRLVFDEAPVADLTPLKGVPSLRELSCRRTEVADLSSLSALGLTSLDWAGSPVGDVSPLRGLPLAEVACDFRRYRDEEILRSLKGLKRINGQPAADFWEKAATEARAFDEWCRTVAGLLPKEQVEAVRRKLQELNPGFDESVSPFNPSGAVKELDFLADNVTDLSPVRALPRLEQLVCAGSAAGKGKLYDLSPLKGMSLTGLECGSTRVKDLSPLRGMRLTRLVCCFTPVSDLSPLSGMPLSHLDCHHARVADLSPLKGMPLTEFACDLQPGRDAEVVRSLTGLKTINGKPAREFWKDVEEKKP
jgi:Leucine-rich repeat (LRR) protein